MLASLNDMFSSIHECLIPYEFLFLKSCYGCIYHVLDSVLSSSKYMVEYLDSLTLSYIRVTHLVDEGLRFT